MLEPKPIAVYSKAITKGAYILSLRNNDGTYLDPYSSYPKTFELFAALCQGFGIEEKVLDDYKLGDSIKLKKPFGIETILRARLKNEKYNQINTGRYEIRVEGVKKPMHKLLFYDPFKQIKDILEAADYEVRALEEIAENS